MHCDKRNEGQVQDLALAVFGLRCFAVTVLVITLGACAQFDFEGKRDRLLERAAEQGWRSELIEAQPFTLFTARRYTGNSPVLTVYIEGDGRSWQDPYTPSDDPTPERPVGLRLALADVSASVLYLARPCQYRDLARSPGCDVRYWTTHRLAPPVIASLSNAIDRAKVASRSTSVELIGYSGGGAAAVLVAARRQDVVRLVTIAANLDLALWARLARVRPLSGSIDPALDARATAHIPQLHLAGADDEIVPPAVIRSYLAKGGLGDAAMSEIPGFDHECCWHRAWAPRIADIRRRIAPRATGS